MPIQRNREQVITLWLEKLAKAKRYASESVGSSNSQTQLSEEFLKLEKELKDMTDIFSKFKSLEKLVKEGFDDIELDIQDGIFDECKDQMKIGDKLENLSKKIAKLLSSVSPLESISLSTPTLEEPKQLASEASKVSDVWKRFSIKLEENILKNEVMGNFKVSYDFLKPQLKRCLLCFSIFPEKSLIRKRPLIYWWIGEGLVTHDKDMTAEEVGENVFTELIEKGMIKAVKKKGSPTVSSCEMHPWIRLMLISVAKNAGFFDFDATGKPMAECPKSRRSCIVSPEPSLKKEEPNPNPGQVTLPVSVEDKELPKTQSDPPNRKQENKELRKTQSGPPNGKQVNAHTLAQEEQRILFNVNEKYLKITSEMFSKKNKLSVIQLGRWQNSATHHIEVDSTDFLKVLGNQRHLAYLSFRGISRLGQFPDSVANLTHLKILDLRACHNLEKLPSEIKAMKKLTHLDVSECYLLESMPKGVEFLSNLQVLKGFVIGRSSIKGASRFKELGKLKNLRKLSIYVASDASVTEKELGELQHLDKLLVLKITWGGALFSTPITEGNPTLGRAETINMKTTTQESAGMVEAFKTMAQKFLKFNKKETMASKNLKSTTQEDAGMNTEETKKTMTQDLSKFNRQETMMSKNLKRQASKILEATKLKKPPTLPVKSISMPPNMKKLHLLCFPENTPPYWLSATQLQKLEKLYILGGKLVNLGSNDDSKWKVKVLRLKFLKDLNIEWSDLMEAFPDLSHLECPNLKSSKCDKDGLWVKLN